jgi:hypothetical protein
MWGAANRYILPTSGSKDPGPVFDFATVDESVSDFVAHKVDARLQLNRGVHAFRWFDPLTPTIPEQTQLAPSVIAAYQNVLTSLTLPNNRRLQGDQVQAILDGLNTTVQLLQGPPGTGKTMTLSGSILTRILARRSHGDIVLIAANTHTAVNNLLERIDTALSTFVAHARSVGLSVPTITLSKVHTSKIAEVPSGNITNIVAKPSARDVNRMRRDSVLVIGGTTPAVLKLAEELSTKQPFIGHNDGFQVPVLVIDEASMMVFPHFLALATLVQPHGEILLAGDHRQLAPILAHDWETEDRPPSVLYQPYVSAYQAVQNIVSNSQVSRRSVGYSALNFTFRLPPVIRDLLARLYRLDDIELEGLPRNRTLSHTTQGNIWDRVWQGETGLYLVLHDEARSRRYNELEAEIISLLLDASGNQPAKSIAVITPYRDQRRLCQTSLSQFQGVVDVIDTVERLQGGERPTIIVSGTASDRNAIAADVKAFRPTLRRHRHWA